MSSYLLYRPKSLMNALRCNRLFSRPMGGGPRTFPGGLNKWQWKRMHEKKAREKEKRLLDQEKQLYQARIRSEIRSKLFSKSDSDSKTDQAATDHSPMTPQQHIKALADRFMRAGAGDLWNEDDGPLKSSDEQSRSIRRTNERPSSFGSPIDLRSLISDTRGLIDNNYRNFNSENVNLSSYVKTRNYSVASGRSFNTARSLVGNVTKTGKNSKKGSDFVKKTIVLGPDKTKFSKDKSSSGEDELGFDNGNKVNLFACNLGSTGENGDSRDLSEFIKKWGFVGQKRFKRDESSSSGYDSYSDLEDIDEKVGGWRDVKKTGSSASLGKYDMKITKRVPLKNLEKENDFSQQAEFIRKEISEKKLAENGDKEVQREEESILSQKRFDECGISPLTVKALTEAGYVQMTRVQNATLSVCLEGNDAMVKAKTGTGKSAAFLFRRPQVVVLVSGCRQYLFLFSVL